MTSGVAEAPGKIVRRGSSSKFLAACVTCIVPLLLCGCGLATAPIIDPNGPITLAERNLLFRAFAIMLIVIVPVFVMAFWFAWYYRASNTSARYRPTWSYSGILDGIVWAVPALIVISLGVHLWIYTHKLDPYKALDPSVAPLEVQVVAQDWKWLFIYPEQNIASVNQLVVPNKAPLTFRITSDTVMNSFFIPALGGQIYAMAGMQTQLNLIADETGSYQGRNMQYSGDGFADQHFEVVVKTPEEFDAWVEEVRRSPDVLDAAAYAELAKPSSAHPVVHYSSFEPDLFDSVIMKYTGTSHAAMDRE